ncbi:MAG: phage terminase small subunit P27 family [Pseudomonadota bacterium]
MVAGTAQPCRTNDAAPVAPERLPVAPGWLTVRGAEIFDQLVALLDEMGIASCADTQVVTLCASRIEEVEITTALIEDNGRTYETVSDTGSMFRSRPEVAQRNEAMRHTQSLLSELGLTPAARSKVSVNAKPEGNPFKNLG